MLLSHAMIYDAPVATDLIITVYFPSAGENGEVSDFRAAFIPPLLFHKHLLFIFLRFSSHLPALPLELISQLAS